MESIVNMTQRKLDGCTIFDINGDFDSRCAGQIKEQIRDAILGGAINVIINLENVYYIDSAGLGTLVSALKTAKEKGGSIKLAGVTPQVQMVVQLTRLHYVFDIYDNVDLAVKEIDEPSASECAG
jgi:anti-sigma B factor antagonist